MGLLCEPTCTCLGLSFSSRVLVRTDRNTTWFRGETKVVGGAGAGGKDSFLALALDFALG